MFGKNLVKSKNIGTGVTDVFSGQLKFRQRFGDLLFVHDEFRTSKVRGVELILFHTDLTIV